MLHRVVARGREGLGGVLESQDRGIVDLARPICRIPSMRLTHLGMQQPLREVVEEFPLVVWIVKVCSTGWFHRAKKALGAFWSHRTEASLTLGGRFTVLPVFV